MSTRTEALGKQAGKSHPATTKLTWDNTNKTFKVYHKSTKTTTLASLPMKFIVIDNYISINGWCEKSGSSFYSNEIKNVNTETLTIKDGTGTVLAGKYTDFKDKLAVMGAKYAESIYVLFEDGTIGNIVLNGSNVAEWFKFKEEAGKNILTQWVGMGNPQSHKKGSITWATPEIKLLGNMSDEDATNADNAYYNIQDYKKGITTTESSLSIEDVKEALQSSRADLDTDDLSVELGY